MAIGVRASLNHQKHHETVEIGYHPRRVQDAERPLLTAPPIRGIWPTSA
jgi:hypothetical protein